MLNSKALEAAMVAYFDGEHSWRTGLSNFIAERTEGAMSDAITAYLEALLPADDKEVVMELQDAAKLERSQGVMQDYYHDELLDKAASLLQAQAAEIEAFREMYSNDLLASASLAAKIDELEARLLEPEGG